MPVIVPKLSVEITHKSGKYSAKIIADTARGRAAFGGSSDTPIGAIESALDSIKRTKPNIGPTRKGRPTKYYNVACELLGSTTWVDSRDE